MYKSVHTGQWEECPLDMKEDCGKNTCEGCPSNNPPGYDDDWEQYDKLMEVSAFSRALIEGPAVKNPTVCWTQYTFNNEFIPIDEPGVELLQIIHIKAD